MSHSRKSSPKKPQKSSRCKHSEPTEEFSQPFKTKSGKVCYRKKKSKQRSSSRKSRSSQKCKGESKLGTVCNPLSGRYISKDGALYKQLVKKGEIRKSSASRRKSSMKHSKKDSSKWVSTPRRRSSSIRRRVHDWLSDTEQEQYADLGFIPLQPPVPSVRQEKNVCNNLSKDECNSRPYCSWILNQCSKIPREKQVPCNDLKQSDLCRLAKDEYGTRRCDWNEEENKCKVFLQSYKPPPVPGQAEKVEKHKHAQLVAEKLNKLRKQRGVEQGAYGLQRKKAIEKFGCQIEADQDTCNSTEGCIWEDNVCKNSSTEKHGISKNLNVPSVASRFPTASCLTHKTEKQCFQDPECGWDDKKCLPCSDMTWPNCDRRNCKRNDEWKSCETKTSS